MSYTHITSKGSPKEIKSQKDPLHHLFIAVKRLHTIIDPANVLTLLSVEPAYSFCMIILKGLSGSISGRK
jgi:hypothetical protein